MQECITMHIDTQTTTSSKELDIARSAVPATVHLGNLLDAKNRAKGHLSKWPWKATMAVEHTHGRGKPFGHENEA